MGGGGQNEDEGWQDAAGRAVVWSGREKGRTQPSVSARSVSLVVATWRYVNHEIARIADDTR